MPYKKSDLRGDLYLNVRIQFPDDEWLQDGDKLSKLQALLPGPAPPIVAETVDEVDHDETAKLEDFGKDEQNGEAWEDEEDDVDGVPQCAQQ
jgi:DnaJ family protein A protein 2